MYHRFESTCGHTVEGYIQQVDDHIYAVHERGEIFTWQMFDLATGEFQDTFQWPLS